MLENLKFRNRPEIDLRIDQSVKLVTHVSKPNNLPEILHKQTKTNIITTSNAEFIADGCKKS